MKKVCGIGINDSPYSVNWEEGGIRKRCPIYSAWKGMLRRTTSESKEFKTYLNCSVTEDWLLFSNFLSWSDGKFKETFNLDKDLIVQGNQTYSPETCCFIPKRLNDLFKQNAVKSSELIGVRERQTSSGKIYYEAYAKTSSAWVYLGTYGDALSAHREWQKHRICVLEDAIQQSILLCLPDNRVVSSLKQRIISVQKDINTRQPTTML